MGMNRVQFQQGMSLPQFLKCFGTPVQCEQALCLARWPDGFRCPRCSSEQHYEVGHTGRRLFQCRDCRHQTSATAGSMMEHTKLPLTTWFLAMYLLSQAKTGMSALSLKRHLGVSYPTAWLMHHKISLAMAAQDDAHQLAGVVQLDDAYLGGERSGGTAGRGSENKVPFVAAVSLNEHGRPMYLKLKVLSGFTARAVGQWAKTALQPGTLVLSDGLGCFPAVELAGCVQLPTVVGNLKPRDLPEFKWINTALGNLKTMLAGTFHCMNFRKYAQTYLSAFAYRFNRRFDLQGLVARLIVDVSRSKPCPESTVRGNAEADC
jgi:transposase-like protein